MPASTSCNQAIIAGILLGLIGAASPLALFAADAVKKPVVNLATLPDATIDFDGRQFRLIFGGASGKGVVHYLGKDYKFTMSGTSTGSAGYTEVAGEGTVHNLKKLRDFAGHYVRIGAGADFGAARGGASFQNGKGVVITARPKGEGVELNMGLSAVDVKLGK